MAVITADDSSFATELSGKKVVVKYYADWCGSCKLFAPKFRRLSEDERFKDVLFLDVNAEKSPEARKMAKVDNLPFFAVFNNGELIDGKSTSMEPVLLEMLEKL